LYMKLKLAILFILDTLVLILLTYFMLDKIDNSSGIVAIIFLAGGLTISIIAFLFLYYKFLRLPAEEKKQVDKNYR